MATGSTDYPTSLDTTSNQPLASTLVSIELDGDGTANNVHSNVHGVSDTAIVQLETKIGTGASTATANKVLRATGTGVSAWAQVGLTTDVTGTLPVANGGTGATSLTDKAVLISQDSGTDTVSSVALSSSGQLLIGGTSGPAAGTITADDGLSVTVGDGTIELDLDLMSNGGLEITSDELSVAQGISQYDVAQFASGVADNDFLKVDGTTIEGRSASEVLSDIGAGTATLTGSTDNTVVTVTGANAIAGEANLKFTGSILELGDDIDLQLKEAGKVNFVDVAPDDGEATGLVLSFIADVNLAIGELVYIVADGSDGKVGKADASGVATMPAIGVAVTAVSADAACEILVQGLLRRDSAYGFTIGQDLFVSETAGAITATTPTTSAAVVQKVGVALHADIAYYNFNTTEVLLA
jgi:hypothetical protein